MNNKKNNKNTVDFSGQTQVFDIIRSAFAKYAEQPAFTCLGQTLTYKEIEDNSKALACYLQQHSGLVPGDRIAIQLPNLIQFPIAAYAALQCGYVLVNTNPLYTEREMRHQFSDAGVKAVIILSDLLPKLENVLKDTNITHVLVTKATDMLMPQAHTESYEANDGVVFNNFLKALDTGNNNKSFKEVSGELEDLAALQYTGGTTGLSKGAMLSHKNLLANVQQTYQRFEHVCEDGKDIYVAPLPLYHIYAFTVNLLLAASHGTHNILIPNPRDLDAFVSAIKPYQFTCVTGINTLFVGLCHHPDFKKLDFSKLRLTVSGGSALTVNAAKLWKEATGCTISEGYGLSETSPVLSFNEPGNEKIGTIGFPLMDTEVQIWDENNNPVSQGQEGELVAKGPQVMSGYWQRADATAESIINGFFKTGDIALYCDDGRLKIVDRKKDMVIVSGFNVYPNEIEDVLSIHDDIIEAAVIGKTDEHSGERVCAYVVKSEGSTLDQETLQAYCKESLTAYKVPKEIHFIAELPKSSVGKVLRRELRD